MMAGWLEQLTQRKKSAGDAKDRLKLVLIHDRTDLSQEDLASMKDEILKVISKYVEIDPETVRISMAHEGREQRLVADIPVKNARRRRSK